MGSKQTNCPNCGAPVKHYYNYCCEYCGTFLHNTDEEIKNLNNVEVTIDRVDIERSPLRHSVIITLTGISTPKLQWYEEGIQEIIISGDTLGKRVGYRIEIPLEEFYEGNKHNSLEVLWKYVIDRLPPVFEKQEEQIIEMLIDADESFWRCRK